MKIRLRENSDGLMQAIKIVQYLVGKLLAQIVLFKQTEKGAPPIKFYAVFFSVSA